MNKEKAKQAIAGAIRLVNLYSADDGHEYIEGSEKLAEAALNALIEYLPDYTDLKYDSKMLEHDGMEFGSYLLYQQLKSNANERSTIMPSDDKVNPLAFNPDYSTHDVIKMLTEENHELEQKVATLQAAEQERQEGWRPMDTIPENINVNIYIGDGNTINTHVFQYCSTEEMVDYMKKAQYWQYLPNPPIEEK